MGSCHLTNSLATIMGIGTAVPPHIIRQEDFPDYYFRLSGSDCEHLTPKFKNKFVRLCVRSEIEKRHMHLTEEILKENPTMLSYGVPSLNIRQKLVASEVPKLAAEAASKAIEDWGQPRKNITHVVFSAVVSSSNPGQDVKMIELLGLDPSIKRVSLYQQGCYAGGTALRIAKDLAENNAGSRVLVVCAESTISSFQGPSDDERNVMSQILFGDGASAAIVGADPIPSLERPLFEIVDTSVHIIPNSADLVTLDFLESGLILHVSEDVPSVISSNLEKALVQAFSPIRNIKDWNSLFWVTHPGGRKILDMIEANLGLTKDKLRASRMVLREYGNMIGACLLFILDEIRKSSIEAGMSTTGEGKEEGIVLGFGPGLTVEAVILRAVPLSPK